MMISCRLSPHITQQYSWSSGGLNPDLSALGPFPQALSSDLTGLTIRKYKQEAAKNLRKWPSHSHTFAHSPLLSPLFSVFLSLFSSLSLSFSWSVFHFLPSYTPSLQHCFSLSLSSPLLFLPLPITYLDTACCCISSVFSGLAAAIGGRVSWPSLPTLPSH